MSSETNKNHESDSIQPEKAETYLDVKRAHEEEPVKAETEKIDVEKAEKDVEEQQPRSSSEMLKELEVPRAEPVVRPPDNDLRRIALNNYLIDIRSHLKILNKSFSKIIHQPFVNAVSEVTAKSVVRPTAILSGGIFMFIGSAVYLYATYSTNARYNFFVALFLFVGGFLAGLIVELIYNIFFKQSKA